MFRYSFDPETFSFVEVDENGDACPTRPPTRSKAPLRFGDCFSGAGGLSLGLQAAGLQQEFAVANFAGFPYQGRVPVVSVVVEAWIAFGCR